MPWMRNTKMRKLPYREGQGQRMDWTWTCMSGCSPDYVRTRRCEWPSIRVSNGWLYPSLWKGWIQKVIPTWFQCCLTSLHRKKLLVKLNVLWPLSSTTCSRSIRPLLCILFPRKMRKVLKYIYFFCQSYFSVRLTSLRSMKKQTLFQYQVADS